MAADIFTEFRGFPTNLFGNCGSAVDYENEIFQIVAPEEITLPSTLECLKFRRDEVGWRNNPDFKIIREYPPN